MITNEEALMLQRLKEKFGLKLINQEAKAFQDFLKHFSKVRGKTLYETDFKEIMREADFVISIGSKLRNDNPNARYAFNNVQKINKGAGFYFHPVGDKLIPTFGKTVETFQHKPNDEESVLYLIIDLFADRNKIPNKLVKYLDSFKEKRKKIVKHKVMEEVVQKIKDKKTGQMKEVKRKVPKMVDKEVEYQHNKLVDRVGGDAKNFDDMFEKFTKKKSNFVMMVGEDCFFHKKAKNIANLLSLIETTCDIKVALIPPKSNSLGVSLICDLDDKSEGFTVGYNTPADFTISALGNGDLDIPALNQQEGTLTTMNKRVVPTYPALPYGGYELNDLMNGLGIGKRYTIDWTAELPVEKGFQAVKFDDLNDGFDNSGEELRGYKLANLSSKKEKITIDVIDDKNLLTGENIAYRCNPQRQFSDFTDKAEQIFEKFGLYASPEMVKKLGSRVKVEFENGSLTLDVIEDDRMSGNIVEVPDFKSDIDTYRLFGDSRYAKVTIKKV
jgi:NADH-quinone oxidoreductase subunit G